mgnify:CR=1 FL=1
MTAVQTSTARLMAMVFYVPRACLPPKRRRILAIPIGAALLFGALAHAVRGDRAEAFAGVADAGLLPLNASLARRLETSSTTSFKN